MLRFLPHSMVAVRMSALGLISQGVVSLPVSLLSKGVSNCK